ncbi:LamG-like jellyroll fold domain-containing protein [Streptomyces polygonati]|uniref:LamG-like jellyroll fold domain-containing protein n=1 Tax=Streptomyces polygonati TaxID=1617087 RepID=A0ABV8HX97_9ACTN
MNRRLTKRKRHWGRTALTAAAALWVAGAAGLTSAQADAPGAPSKAAGPPGRNAPVTHNAQDAPVPENLTPLPSGYGLTPADQDAMRTAAATARRTGVRTAVDSLTTPTDEVLADPSGTFLLDANAQPVRARKSDRWVPVDLRLKQRSDGSWAPAATAYGTVAFSGGGDAPLAVTSSGGTSLALTWPTALPVPAVSGSTATYRSVLPGVDLVMSATADGGLSDVLVIHSAQAARNPALRSLRLGSSVRGGKLAVARDGGLALTDSRGDLVADGATPLAWDSNTVLPGSAQHNHQAKLAADPSDSGHPGLAARIAPVRVKAAGGSLTLAADPGLLANTSTVWPVYADPSVNWHPVTAGTPMFDEVKQGCPGNSFVNKTSDLADNGYLGVGYNGWQEGSCYTGDEHAVYQWNLPKSIWGADIHSAEVDATDIYSASCATTATVNLHWSKGMGSGTDWSNRPGYNSYSTSASFGPAYNPTYCPNNGSTTNGFNVLTPIRSSASAHSSTFTVTLSEDSLESKHNDLGFKRFEHNPTLQIFFNNAPNAPTASTMSAVSGADDAACDTVSPYPYMGKTIATTPPVLKAKVSDPNSDKLQATFQYWINGQTTMHTVTSGDNLSSGTFATTSLTSAFMSSLTNGQTVDWNVKITDGMDSTAYSQSPTCHFTAEPTAPDAPTVTSESNLYPNTDTTDAVVGATAGTAGRFDIAGAGTAATKFVYNLDVPPAKTSPPAAETITATGNAAVVTVTPPSPGPHTLWVYAVDAAGDASGDFAYPFLAAGHPSTTCATLTACFNNTGISSDTATTQADIDGSGDSFSATDLAGAGWASGGKVTVDGATFTLPAFGAGQKDNVVAANQTVTYSGSGSALEFLATSTYATLATPGAIAGDDTAPYVPAGTGVSGSYCFSSTDGQAPCAASGTVTYTDGTFTTYDLTVPNWWDISSSLPAVVLPHRNDASGTHASAHGLFAFSVPTDPTRTIASVTLPDVGTSHAGYNAQNLHIFGMTTRNTTAGTPEVNGTYKAPAAGQSWTGAWANPNESNSNLLTGGVNYSNQTFRTALQPSISGSTVRVRLDNSLGTTKMSVGHATIALSSNATAFTSVPTGTPTTLTFGGAQAVTVPQGGMVYSDPINFTVTAGHYLLVSFQLTNSVPFVVTHSYANGSYTYVAAVGSGDLTTSTSATPFTTNAGAYGNFTQLITGLDVQTTGVPTEAVLGDHLVDPFQPNTTPPNSNGFRVSDALAGAEPTTAAPFGVLAEGIESNQLMTDNPETYNGGAIGGPAVLSRIDRDVLDQPGINTVVVDEGLEDLLGGTTTSGDLEDNGYTALVQQLQNWGINVVLTSLTPCEGYNGDGATPNDPCTSTVDDNRTDVNAFLGGMNLGNPWSAPAVYFADLDAAVAEPDAYNGEERLAPSADSGDHVNLSLRGYGALANAIMSPQDNWAVDDGDGMPVATDTAATDTPQTPGTILNPNTGNSTLTLSATGSTWGDDPLRGTVLNLDGTAGNATSATPVLDTSGSFAVSAWVKPTSLPTHNMTIAAQEGTTNSAFALQYNYSHTTAPTWAFATTNGDATGPAFTYAYATGPSANLWTHLVGVYNAAAHTTQLYVNGALAGSATGVTLWNAPDAYTVGRGLYNGNPTDFLSGAVSGVQVYDYALTANQAGALYGQGAAGGGPYTFADTVDFNGDGTPDLVAETPSGDLWMFPGDGTHGPDTADATLVGWSFSTYTIAGIADFNGDGYPDIVAKDASGLLWLYPGDADHDTSTARVEIGTGWGSYVFAGVRDWNGDGHPDVIAKDSTGNLWMYPSGGTINGTSTLGARSQIGTSWSTYTLEGLADWDNDGHMDLLAMDSTGVLWLYPGDTAHDTSTARVQLGTGWTNFPFAGLADWNSDGNTDIITRGPGSILWAYPSRGTRTTTGTRYEIGLSW